MSLRDLDQTSRKRAYAGECFGAGSAGLSDDIPPYYIGRIPDDLLAKLSANLSGAVLGRVVGGGSAGLSSAACALRWPQQPSDANATIAIVMCFITAL